MAAANRRALALGLLARSAMSRATPTGPCVGDPIARQWWDHRRSRLSEPALWATNARPQRNITVAHRVRHKNSDTPPLGSEERRVGKGGGSKGRCGGGQVI